MLLELELTDVKEELEELKQDIQYSDLIQDQLARKSCVLRDQAVKRKIL